MTHALLLATALATQAQAGDKPPPLTIQPKRVADLDVGLSGATFDVVLEAERTRGITVRLRHLDYEVRIGGAVVAQGVREYDNVRLRRGEPVKIRVPVELSGREALQAAGKIASGRELKIKVRGSAGLGIWFIPFTVPFAAKGP